MNPHLKALRWRLLGSSLGVIGCTLTVFGIVVYQVVAQSLEQKSDRQLKNLADAAAHSLSEIAANPAAIERTPTRIDNDGDLDLPWQDLRQSQQSIEWFDSQGQLLARAGRAFPFQPLVVHASSKRQPHADIDRDDPQLHTLTIAVQSDSASGSSREAQRQLQGFVRVTESNERFEEELVRLRSGLQWGGLLALILSAAGGWWLTQQSLQPIDRSIRQLKQFTADASHELRNPLTAIKASVEVMQSHADRLSAADGRKLEAIASATHQMSRLVDDLLWLARSDRATPSSTSVLIPLPDLLEEVLDQYLAQSEQQQIALKISRLEEITIWGDPAQLKRLFGNLISNALRYTPAQGTVTVSAFQNAAMAIVQVRDTGIGIASDHLPLVFDRFWRADHARVQQEGGSGLGLSIAQAIAQQHQGQIQVFSELGQGSCFQVELPIA